MSGRRGSAKLRGTILAGVLLAAGTAAGSETITYVDLQAGLGASTNPFLRVPSSSSAFGRLSASGLHSWTSERGATTLTGYVENTSYLHDYGSQQIFNLAAHTNQRLSPTVTIFGDLGFSGDFAGQLSNRFLTVPSQPPVVEPGNPLPPVTNNPDLVGFSGRQYRLNGQVGASIRSGARGSISLSGGAERAWFPRNGDANYNTYFVSGGYAQQVSERTSAGASLYLTRQDFQHGDWANIVNPVGTLQTQLTESLKASATFGVMAIDQKTAGQKDRRVTPSFSGSLCKSEQLSNLCVHVSRDAQSGLSSRIVGGGGEATVTTTAGVDYYRRLSADSTIQASFSGSQYSSSAVANNSRFTTTYVQGVVGYDRKVRSRLYAGVSGGVRKLFQDGKDPDTDFNANVYLRYRLGDNR